TGRIHPSRVPVVWRWTTYPGSRDALPRPHRARGGARPAGRAAVRRADRRGHEHRLRHPGLPGTQLARADADDLRRLRLRSGRAAALLGPLTPGLVADE